MIYYYLTKDLVEHNLEKFHVCKLENNIATDKIEVYFLKTQKTLSVSLTDLICFDIAKTGDTEKFKICDRCFKCLKSSDFVDNRQNAKGKDKITKRPSCKLCRVIKDGKNLSFKQKKEWRATNGKTGDLLTCPICNKLGIWGIKKFVADHNHITGKIRGTICESCNTGLGRFDDKIEILEQAIKWLKEK